MSSLYDFDDLKGKALEALLIDCKPEATLHYVEINKKYQSLITSDAQLAVLFNLLLSSLEQKIDSYAGQREEVCEQMISLFLQSEPSYLSQEIAKRIQILMQETIDELSASVSNQLVEAATKHYEYVSPTANLEQHVVLDHTIRANTIAQLYPEDSALLCFLMIAHAKDKEKLSQWLNPLQKLFVESHEIPNTVYENMDVFRAHYLEENYIDAYMALLSCIEWAVDYHPFCAAEWIIGLQHLADLHKDQLGKLAYKSTVPEEQMIICNIKFHLKLAQALNDEVGTERLCLRHWQMVFALTTELKEKIYLKEQVYGKNISDNEKKVYIAYWFSMSCIAQGEFQTALDHLEEIMESVRKRHIRNDLLSAQICYQYASIFEKFGHVEKSIETYLSVINFLSPDFLSLQSIDQISHFSQNIQTRFENNLSLLSTKVLLLVKTFCALLRLGHVFYSPNLSYVYRTWLHYFRYALPYQDWLESLLYLELTACYYREYGAPAKALEIARAMACRSAIILSMFYQILEKIDCDPQDPTSWQGIKRLMLESKRVGGGQIQRVINIGAILLQLKQLKLNGQMPDAEFETQISESIEQIQDSLLSNQSSPLDIYLPLRHPELNIEEHIIELIKNNQRNPTLQENIYAKIARWLCTINRGMVKHFHYVTPYREFADRIRNYHHRQFRNKWIDRQPPDAFKIYDDLLARRETAKWSHRSLNQKELRVEFQVFSDCVVVFLIKQHQIIQARQIDIKIDYLYQTIQAFRDAIILHQEAIIHDLSSFIYQNFFGDLDQEISNATRLIIVPDGVLRDLPFAVLKNSKAQYLAQRIEIAIAYPTTGPVFSASKSNQVRNQVILVGSRSRNFSGEMMQINKSLSSVSTHVISQISSDQFITHHHSAAIQNEVSMVYLNASIHDGPSLIFSGTAEGEHIQCPLGDAISELANRRVGYAILSGPINGEVGHTTIRALLTSLYYGLLVKQWYYEPQDLQSYMTAFWRNFFTNGINSSSTIHLIESLAFARRTAINEKVPPREWANFEIFISDRQ